MYPIVNLRDHQQDMHWYERNWAVFEPFDVCRIDVMAHARYLRALEEVVILALKQVSNLKGERIDGLTGVWVEGRKVAAIGVRATRYSS